MQIFQCSGNVGGSDSNQMFLCIRKTEVFNYLKLYKLYLIHIECATIFFKLAVYHG